MSYLLDTNACIAVINGRPEAVRGRLRGVLGRSETVAVSAVALFELWYGVAKSARFEVNAERLAVFMAGVGVLPFDGEDARGRGGVGRAGAVGAADRGLRHADHGGGVVGQFETG